MNHSTHATSWRRWTLIGLILALGLNVAIRWHLRAMPLERDEGEYAYAGQLILQGILPYKLAFNMKFPGVYFMYAFLMAIFGQSTAGIHIGIVVVTSVTAVLIFLIGRELLADSGALIAAIIYICLAALPKAAGLAGHATHFVSLFVCAGVWALLMGRKGKPNPWWFVSGLAFGLAILMKQHAVFFPFFILVWFLWNGFRKEAAQKVIFSAILFCAGCVAPFLASAITFARAGLWHAFIFWTFDYARQYVSMLPLRAAPGQFVAGFDPVFESGIWPWLFGVAGLICSAWAKGNLWHSTLPAMAPATAGAHPHSQASDEAPPAIRDWRSALPTLVFLAGWAAVVPGFYFRNHYFLMLLPWLALLNGAFFQAVGRAFNHQFKARRCGWLPLCLAAFVVADLMANNARMWFDTAPVQLSRRLYPGNPFPEAVQIAGYVKDHSAPADTVAVLGSEPEIFFLAHRHSASGYIYVYSLTEPQPLAPRMGKEFISQIESSRPKYVVFVNMALSWYSLILPQSLDYASDIQNWWANYSTNYDLVGAVKISRRKPAQFFWNDPSLNTSDATNDDVLIYRRKAVVQRPFIR